MPTEERFRVDVPGFSGSLEQLVAQAQRGEVDLDGIEVSRITGDFRSRLGRGGAGVDLRELADFLTLAARLVSLKAARLNPAAGAEAGAEEGTEIDDPGARLAEYRLFVAAAEALLAEAAEEGARSFLSLVAPEVLPVERLRIPPERLAAAFRAVLQRIEETETLPAGAVTFSVEDKIIELRGRLSTGSVAFESIFDSVSSRLEAVACFLALLELVRRGEAAVEQDQPFGAITVRARG
ncbi:MAG: segregation and condensation protein A [Candidatus Dormibacteria bacterium]